MSETDRREFLKRTGLGITGLAALGGCRSPGSLSREPAFSSALPAPHREIRLPGFHGYADRESVRAGEEIAFHVSASEPYRLSIARLGSDVDGPSLDEIFHEFPASPARVQPIHPGSYVHVERGLFADGDLPTALTLECWVRPFRTDVVQPLIACCDSSRAGGFGLFVLGGGAVAFTCADADAIDLAAPSFAAGELARGRWHHVTGTWDGETKRIWIDGELAGEAKSASRGALSRVDVPLRLGAASSDGSVSHFLDGDLAMVVVRKRALPADEVRSRFETRGLEPARGDDVLACFAFTEEGGDGVKDSSSHERHARIVNHGTWMVGGPSFDADVPRFGAYDAGSDPERGHGLRLASDDLPDCRWEATHRFRIPEDGRSGYWVARAEYELAGEPYVYHIPFVVRRARGRARAPIVFLAATNTWRAYNATPFAAPRPGLRHVAGTDGLPNSPGDPPAYSFYRPHAAGQGTYWVGMRVPLRLGDPYVRYGDLSDYSHLMRAERFTQIWLKEHGYDYEVVTDLDLHDDPEALRDRKAFVIAGHSEYWSADAYRRLEEYLAGGGNVACLSGNSLFWRVSYDSRRSVLECRKADAPGNQVLADRRGECWHEHDGRRGGLLAECGYPGWKLIGLATLGWNNHGDPAQFTPFVVENASHPFFHEPEPVGVANGDALGQAPDGGMPRANGHEVDVRLSTLASILEKPPPEGASHPEDPPGIELLAAGKAWPNTAPKFDYWLRGVTPDRPIGGEVIWWERPAGGHVFNAGSIATGAALSVDPRLGRLLANVLARFGVKP